MSRHHSIDYIELSVTNLAESKKFYSQVFGWSFKDYGPKYCGIQGDEHEMGGFEEVDEVSQGGPLVVLFSEDLEATWAAVVAAGGEIVKELSFPGGKRFHFRDPSGNVLGVWTTT